MVTLELQKIDYEARQCACGLKNLVAIAKSRGVGISEGMLSESLRGIRSLNPRAITGLLEVLNEMKDLQKAIEQVTGPAAKIIQINWGQTELIAETLTLRTLAQVSQHETIFETAASDATNKVRAATQ